MVERLLGEPLGCGDWVGGFSLIWKGWFWPCLLGENVSVVGRVGWWRRILGGTVSRGSRQNVDRCYVRLAARSEVRMESIVYNDWSRREEVRFSTTGDFRVGDNVRGARYGGFILQTGVGWGMWGRWPQTTSHAGNVRRGGACRVHRGEPIP